MMRMLSG